VKSDWSSIWDDVGTILYLCWHNACISRFQWLLVKLSQVQWDDVQGWTYHSPQWRERRRRGCRRKRMPTKMMPMKMIITNDDDDHYRQRWWCWWRGCQWREFWRRRWRWSAGIRLSPSNCRLTAIQAGPVPLTNTVKICPRFCLTNSWLNEEYGQDKMKRTGRKNRADWRRDDCWCGLGVK